MRILVIEDDSEVANYVVNGLKEQGHVADHAADGVDGLALAMSENYDVMIVDRMLPGMDGLKVLTMLRAGGNQVPAIFLTALDSLEDKVNGLQLSNDYLVKPFAFAELYARICAITRKAGDNAEQVTVLKCRDLKVDLLSRKVSRGSQNIPLQPTEFRLLEYLLRHKGQLVTRTMLLEGVWGFRFDPMTNIVETHISRLRSKIDKGFDSEIITTVRGSGYLVENDDA